MSLAEMHDALAAASEYLQHQTPDVQADESLDELTYGFSVSSSKQAIEGATKLLSEHDATIVLRWELAEVVELEARPSGDLWQSRESSLTVALSALRDREARPEWTTEDLRPAFSELDTAAASHGRLTLRKRSWRTPLEDELDRTLWMGPSMDGFENWVIDQDWRELANALLMRPGAAVVVGDGPATAQMGGPRIEVASSSDQLTPAQSDEELQKRLGLQLRPDELALWRATGLKPGAPLPSAVIERLWGVATSAGAWVLAEDRTDPGRVRPRRDRARAYELSEKPDLNEQRGAALRELASWVAEDLSAARIAVAQHVAAREISEPFDETAAQPVRQAADIAYHVAIDQTVGYALERQAAFEQTFVDLDKSVAETRGEIASAVDQVVARTLTGASAFAIAALASPRFRGVAALIAGALIAVFVAANIVLLHRSTRAEALERLKDAEDQIAKRRARLSAELSQVLTVRLGAWRDEIKRRIRVSTAILAALIVTLVGVGLGVALTTDYEGSSPSLSCTCHATGPRSICTCATPR